MFHLRLKIFIALCISGLLVTVGRLLILQTTGVEAAREGIAAQQILAPQQRPTIRGQILDRHDRPLALDIPAFYLQIKYQLTRYRDPRWREGVIRYRTRGEKTREQVEGELAEKWAEPMGRLNKAIDLANVLANVSEEDILGEIDQINNQVWKLARRVWWRRRNRQASWDEYYAIRETIEPEKVVTVDLMEMYQSYPLLELKTEEDLLRAQVELIDLDGLEIKPLAKRHYPYGHAACQLIGWVGPVREAEMLPFEDAEYLRKYRPGELIGKAGLERIYEPVLRGRRGEVTYDLEGNVLHRKEPEYGKDIRLTIDIELQQRIENLLSNPLTNKSAHKPSAAVVLDAAGNDILALVSTPTFDLATIRLASNYNRIYNDPNYIRFSHRGLEKNYPPGSTAKPLILIAGLQEKKTWPDEIINCTYQLPPKGWPRCIAQWKFHNPHDNKWANTGRNAIRGSCNVYFSQLANRLDRGDLQEWFFRFGYGQKILPTPMPDDLPLAGPFKREIKQAHGNLSSTVQTTPFTDSWDLPLIKNSEKRFWGIGQGSLRVTVLQVANAVSAIVRGGVYKAPRLIYDDQDPFNDKYRRQIPVSSKTLAVVRDGMHAVVYETGGTAYSVFKKSDLFERDMTIYGKTGSTQSPEVAWFECFSEDEIGRAIVITVLVEGGLSGSGEAAPLGKEILRICNEAGYIGTKPASKADPAETANLSN